MDFCVAEVDAGQDPLTSWDTDSTDPTDLIRVRYSDREDVWIRVLAANPRGYTWVRSAGLSR
jgi:hypothetical protein